MISGSELARRTGITRQAIHNQAKAGHIPFTLDEKGRPRFDDTDPAILEYINTAKPQRRSSGGKSASGAGENADRSEFGPEIDGESDIRSTSSRKKGKRSWKSDNSGGEAYMNAERRKMIAAADMAELRAAEKRRELVSLESVKRVFAASYAIDSSQLLTLGERISNDLAAAFGIDDPEKALLSKEIIDLSVRGAIDQSKKLMDEFVLQCEAQAI